MANAETALQRLQQTTNHFHGTTTNAFQKLSIVHGPEETSLLFITLGDLLEEQSAIRGDKECLVVPWTGARWTYSQLRAQSRTLAKGLLALGVRHGDRIGILAGNCEEYVAVFFAAGYVGAILVVLNSTYTASEVHHALKHSGKLSVFKWINKILIPIVRFRLQNLVCRRKVRPSYQCKLIMASRAECA
jgi:non-ribosomal peptide synthetase component F